VNKLGVIHLQKHTSDLASQVRLDDLDLGEEVLAENLLLLLGVGLSQLGLEEAGGIEIVRAGSGNLRRTASNEVLLSTGAVMAPPRPEP